MSSIFLSHSSRDKQFARRLAETLTSHGVQVWIDEAELKIGDSLIGKISAAIDKADFVAAILSQNSVRSNWVQKELQLAMTKEIEGRRVTVLPILIERCEIPGFLADKVYADFTDPEDFDGPLFKVLRAVGVSRHTPALPAASKASRPIPQGVVVSNGGQLIYPARDLGRDSLPTRCFRCGHIAQYGSKCAHCGAVSDDF